MALAVENRMAGATPANQVVNTKITKEAEVKLKKKRKSELTDADFPPMYSLAVEESEFGKTNESELLTTVQLGEIINSMFRPFFKDYAGCLIKLTTKSFIMNNAMGMNGVIAVNDVATHQPGIVNIPSWEVELYFQQNCNLGRCVDGAFSNIRSITSNDATKQSSLAQRIANLNTSAKFAKNFTLTDETKDMLAEFFDPVYCEKTKVTREFLNPDFDEKHPENGPKTYTADRVVSRPAYDTKLIYEVTDNAYSTPQLGSVYIKVTNLDLIRLLKKRYGVQNELEHIVDYDVRAIRPINNMFNMQNPTEVKNELLQITRLDTERVKNLYNTLGMMTMATNLPIIRN